MSKLNETVPHRSFEALRRVDFRAGFRTMGMLPVLVILCGLIQAATIYVDGEGRFITAQNISIVAQQAAINTVLGAGMTLVILTGGCGLLGGSVWAASPLRAALGAQVYGALGGGGALVFGFGLGSLNWGVLSSLRTPSSLL